MRSMTETTAPVGLRFSLRATSALPGPRVPVPAWGVLRYIHDPVRVGMALRPASGDGIATTAAGHSALLVCYGERWARMCFTDMETWQRPNGGLVQAPRARPAVANLMRTIVLSNGEDWQRRRRLAMPSTHKEALLDGMRASFTRTIEELTRGWSPGEPVDASAGMLQVSLRNNVRCLMGLEPADGEPLAKQLDWYANALLDPGVALTQRMSNALLGGRPMFGTPYARWVHIAESAESTLRALVQKRRARGGTGDMLGALLASPEDGEPGLSDDEAVGELMGLYAAGYETTARTLAWTLLMLACHPAAARAAQEEAAALLGGDMPTLAQSKQLPLLDAIVRETQRVLPAVPSSIPRVAARDVEVDGYHIPAGSGLVCSITAAHHDERFFPDAYAFLPERWEALRRSPGALTYRFMPFGAGPRRCLGGALADYQLRASVAWLLQRYSFRVPPKARVDYRIRQVVLEPRGPLNLILGPPSGWADEALIPEGSVRHLVRR